MPRKRTIPDEALLDAALLLVREDGPAALSFGALASRVGLAGSTIVQRFKTKAGLLEAALGRAWDSLEAQTAAADAAAPTGPEGVVDLLVRLSGQYDPEAYADQLLLLREDLRNPVLRERGARWLATLYEAIERRLAATSPGAGAGTEGLGPLVVAQWQGALTVWSFTRQAPLDEVVRAMLADLLRRVATRPEAEVETETA
jgi:AcrR family transcriptional regulator